MDHCPPKQLYKHPPPENLGTVPCCSNCNKKFKADEEYLNYVMARIALNPELQNRLREDGSVTRLIGGQEYFKRMLDDADHGEFIDPKEARLENVAKKISMGCTICTMAHTLAHRNLREFFRSTESLEYHLSSLSYCFRSASCLSHHLST